MKKIYCLLISFLSLLVAQTNAQVSSYVFSQSSGTYTPITGTLVAEATDANPGGTPDSGPMDDFTFTNIPIGFTFKFNGINYTSLNANTNGWISFGATSTSTSSPISSTNTYNSVIAASAFDLMGVYATSATRTLGSNVLTSVANTTFCKVGKAIQGAGIPTGSTITAFDATTITISNAATATSTGSFVTFATGEIRTEVSGVAPNRTFTIQLSGFAQYATSLSATTNNTYLEFQIKLTEGGTNGDQAGASIVYGNYYRAGGSSTAQVGLRGGGNADYNNRATTTDWSASTAGVANSNTSTFSNTVFPASGLTFSWAQNPVFVDYCNVQFPPNATIALGFSEIIYTQGYEPGVTEAAGAGTGISVWIATNGANTDPATWPLSAWVPATFNVQVGNNDEFSLAIGANLGAGTHYYASRWLLNTGQYRYGGYSAGGGGYWNGTTNVSGVLTVTPTVANDVCSGAVMLTVNTDLACGTSSAGTTVGATQSPELPAPTCSATGINDDVWFSFVATGTSHVVTLSAATNTTAAQVYGGTCGNLSTIACGSTTSGTANITAPGLVNGNTYYVRVYSTSSTVGTTSNFNICVGTPPAPPANDEICGAIGLSVTGDPTCSTALTGQSTQFSTQSLPGCTGTADEDVWYSFIATNTTHIITLTSSGSGSSDRVHQLYSSSNNTCNGTLTSIRCSDPETSTNTGLTIGNTYFIRVHSFGTGNFATFDICITTPPPPPANDNICGAVSLSVSPDPTCVTALTGQSTQSATQSLVSCNGGTADEDIWYSFVATNTTHIITISNSGSGSTDRVHELFSSSDNTCNGTLTSIGCSDPETSTNTGLTIGNTYFVRVYSYGSGNFATFNICITSPAACPAPTGVSAGAITSTGATITFTGTGSFILEYGLSGFTPGVNATPGVGGTIIAPATSPQAITGLSNTTAYQVYVRQDCTGAGNGFSPNSAVVNFTTLGPPPANDECATATVISSTPVSSSTASATQSQAPLICGGFTSSNANDVWFQFTALSSGDATVTISNAAGGIDAVIQAYSGSCGTLTNIGCADATTSNGNEVTTLNALTAGQTYFIQVYGYSSSRGTFNITVTGAALPISVEYFRGTKQTNSNLLDWKVTCYNSPTVKMEVERSADGRKYNTLQSQTETSLRCLQPFSFADTNPLAGINYYRLKSTDVDGKITYSATVAILNKTKGFEIVSMIPNPVETKAVLSISSAVKATMEIVVTDLAGKQLSKQRVVLIAGSNQVPLNLSNLAAGTYQVTGITDEGERKSVRFVKQ